MNRAPQSFRASTRPIVAPTRALSTCRSASSPSSPPTPPPQAGRASPKNTAVYRTVVRTAVLGAYELSSPAEAPRYSLRSHGFKASKVRKTPESHHGSRAKLVEVDPARVTRDGYSRDPRRAIPSRRQFSTCARRQRVSDDSLGLEDSGADIEGGSWDAERGGNRLRAPRAGDWVETRRDGVPMSGIYLGRGAFSTRRFMILPMSGTLTEASNDDITFVIPGVVPCSVAESASFSNAPEASPSTPEAREMLQRLREIEFAVEEETKLVVSRGGQDLYRLLHAPSHNSTSKKRVASPPSSVTISAALRALRLSPSAPASTHSVPLARQVAMHRVLLDNPAHFLVDDLAVRVTGRFDLRDPLEVARFEKIRDWTREQSGEMTSFAERAAKVREWGRSHPATAVSRDGKLELRKLPEDDSGTFVWTKDDQEIIEFFRDTLAYERVLQSQPHMAIAPSILKLVDQQSAALGLDGWGGDDEIKKQRIRQFLSEIGEVPDWENWVAHARKTGLGTWASTGAKVEGALARKKSSSGARSNGSLGSTDYYPQDPHDSIRHDFGNLAVYTIDDAGAFELDDGVSLSPAPLSSSGKATHWVHVHIADPTALLHPGHLVSRLARVRDHTQYFPEKTWSMLPDKFVEQEKMSLGSAQGGEQKVMSFGMRVEEETGEVLEQDVKVGVVRRVLRLTYAGVDKALGHVPPPPRAKVQHPVQASEGIDPVRPGSRQRQIDDDVLSTDPGAVSTLRTLHNLSKKLLARRVADSALFWNFPSASVSVSPSISPSFKTSSRPTFYASSPLVTLHLPPTGEVAYVDSPATLLVSELMVAANRTAARLSVERGLHVPFRTQSAPTGTPEAIETVLKLRNLATGQASAFEVLKNPIEFAPGANTPSSGPHWPMGINDAYGYVKVTSPLRRYSDLFSHWQLKSALLPSSSASPYATPRFDLPAVLSHIEGFDVAAKARHRLSEASSTFWSLYVVSRKFELLSRLSSPTSTLSASDITPEDLEFVNLLAGGLTAIALRLPSHSAFNNLHIQPVLIPQLGVRGTLQFEKLDMASAVGEEVDVKIDEVVLNSRSKLVVSRR